MATACAPLIHPLFRNIAAGNVTALALNIVALVRTRALHVSEPRACALTNTARFKPNQNWICIPSTNPQCVVCFFAGVAAVGKDTIGIGVGAATGSAFGEFAAEDAFNAPPFSTGFALETAAG